MYDLSKGTTKPLLYEDIVVGAFRKYPEDFQLRGYPEYPDSSDIHKPLYKMKTQGLVRAANKSFELTPQGIEVASRLIHSNQGNKDRLTKPEENEINRIVGSSAFRLFNEARKNEILDTDFYEYLAVTVRTNKGDFIGRLKNVENAVNSLVQKKGDLFSNKIKELHQFLIIRFNEEIEARK